MYRIERRARAMRGVASVRTTLLRCLMAMVVLVAASSAFAQVSSPANINGAFAVNTNNLAGTANGSTGDATLPSLGLNQGVTFDFIATLEGPDAQWRSGLRFNGANELQFQPDRTNDLAVNFATYTYRFSDTVYGFQFRMNGLDNGDETTVAFFLRGVQVPVDLTVVTGQGTNVNIINSGGTLVAEGPGNDNSEEFFEVALPLTVAIDEVRFAPTAKNNGSTGTVTLQHSDHAWARPDIGLTKSSSLDLGGDGEANAGDEITYTYVVTNNGNVPLTNVTLSETTFTGMGTTPTPSFVSGTGGATVALLPQGETLTFEATYSLVNADIGSPTIDNQATVNATPQGGTAGPDDVSDLSDSGNAGDGGNVGDLNEDDITTTSIPPRVPPSYPVTPQPIGSCTTTTNFFEELFDDRSNGGWTSSQSENPPIGFDAAENSIAGTVSDATIVPSLNAPLGVASPSGGSFISSYDNSGNFPIWSSPSLGGADWSGAIDGVFRYEQFNYATNRTGVPQADFDIRLITSAGRLELDVPNDFALLSTGQWASIERRLQPNGTEWTFFPTAGGSRVATREDFETALQSVLRIEVGPEYIVFRQYTGSGSTDNIERYAIDGVLFFACLTQIDVSKGAAVPTLNADGSYDVTYTMVVTNTGETVMTDLTLVDDFSAQMGTAFVASTEATTTGGVISGPAVTLNNVSGEAEIPTANTAGYDGTNGLLSGTDGALLPGDSFEVTVTVRIDPNAAGAPATFENIATAGAASPGGGTVTDASDTDTAPDGSPDGTANVPGETTGVPTEVLLPLAAGDIGVVKSSLFNDENGDGFAQVGETITYTYTVTNEGSSSLSNVVLTETGFTGNGPTPVPALTGGDDGDDILQTTEIWTYAVNYTLVEDDITAGNVDNQATVEADGPGGTTVSDLSDSSNPGDGDGVGTPGDDGPNDNDPTSTPLLSQPIVAQDDVLEDAVDATADVSAALDLLVDNGNGPDTLNGNPTDETEVTVGPFAGGTAVPAGLTLNPDGTVDVAAGTAPGVYTFDYEICEIANPSNCDDATATLTVGSGAIGLVKEAVFNDEITADGNGQVGETISYTYTLTNEGTLPLSDIDLVETGFTGNGAIPVPVLTGGDDGDGILQTTETWIYEVDYTLLATDISDGGVDNQATATGETPGGTEVSDLSDSSNPADGTNPGTPGDGPGGDDPNVISLSPAPIVAQDDVVPDPVDPTVAVTNLINVFEDNGGAGPDTLNGAPTNSSGAMVEIVLSMPPPPGITLNPDGSIDVAAGTVPGDYMFEYEICEINNPGNCDTASVSLTIGEGQIAVLKGAVFNDDVVPDGNGQVGETISYTYTVTNPGDFDLTNPTLTETSFTGAGTPPAPLLTGGDANGDGILQTAETWIYEATYAVVAADLTAGMVDNQATATGETPGGATVEDLSDSSNPGDGDGVGTPDSGLGNDDPTSTPFTDATIAANDDNLPDPLDASVAQPAVLNVLTPTGTGAEDSLDGAPAEVGGVDPVVISEVPAEPVPAGFTLNPNGDVDVAQGTAPGTYSFGYQICEQLNPTNCDTATVTITIGDPAIGITKVSTFNDENFDGFAQVGETITYTYTVTNEGDLPLSSVAITEAAPDFSGAGTAPVPVRTAGDTNGNDILETTERWTYSADYTLVAADVTAGSVTNLATVDASSPAGGAISDMSDSGNPADGDGTPTPGDGPNNDDPTVTPLRASPIVANDDAVAGINGVTGDTNAMNVLTENGDGPDTLGGAATNVGQVAISVVTPATPVGGNPVPVLDPVTGIVSVPPGTPAGPYQITYEICEILNPSNCDTAVATVEVAEPDIDAADDTFTAIPFDGEAGDTTPSVFDNDTLALTPFAPVDVTVTITDTGGLTGATINPDGTITIPPGTPQGTYEVAYEICDVLNPTVCDPAIATILVGGIEAVAEVFPTISGDTGGTTPSILTSDLLNGAPITDPSDVTLTVVSATGGLTLDPGSNGIIVPPGTPDGTYTLTYEICDALNPAICATITETVVVGLIAALPETFPIVTTSGGTTTGSVLDSDLLNGDPVSLDTVSLTLTVPNPDLTLNPDGTITIAEGVPAGLYTLTYEICDLANPTICASVEETVEMGVIGAIETIKTQEVVDNGDGVNGPGDTVTYTITVSNIGNADLAGLTLIDTFTDASGAPLTLDSGPDFVEASDGSAEGDLLIGETATYTASYVFQPAEIATGFVSNTALAEGTPVAPPGYTGPPLALVSDDSDEGNPLNGDDDPTVFTFPAPGFVDGLSITKTAAISTVLRGGVVPYTIVVDNANPTTSLSTVAVDSLPAGFVYVDGSATVDGLAVTPIVESGRIISFPTLAIPPLTSVTITLSARVLTGTTPGDHVNRADVFDSLTGNPLAPTGTATVRIEPEPVFDCGDVIGKVYDDQNGNGYQDQGEPGLPSVRLAGVDGTIITTDQYGRYHVPCAMLPETRGSNFILKVDERSLPTGYRITTENPRVIRLTRGKMKELNFGASISQVVRVDINSRVFGIDDSGKMQLVPAFTSGMERLLTKIKDTPSTVRVAFHLPDNPSEAQMKTARKMTRDVKRYIQKRWRRIGDYKLNIETTYVRRK